MNIAQNYMKLDDMMYCHKIGNALWLLVRKPCSFGNSDHFYYEIGKLDLLTMSFQRFALFVTAGMPADICKLLRLFYPCEIITVLQDEDSIMNLFDVMIKDASNKLCCPCCVNMA